ncbi:MAG: glycine--tRNA ligase [Candidatus Sumerlaeota bacterium]|nr:glycine--tRNA ligase [Candidatus Sumerlaeota bacterium]
MGEQALTMDTIVSLCKRRGVIFPGSEIYNGLGGTFDYGPIGAELKKNVKNAWWRAMIYERNDIEGLDAAILMNRETWVASGHVQNFSDPLMDCRQCKKRFRADNMGRFRILFVKDGAEHDPDIEINAETWEEAVEKAVKKNKRAFDEYFAGAPHTLKPAYPKNCPSCGTANSLTDPRQFNLMFRTFIGPVADEASEVFLRPETAQGIFVNFQNVMTSMRRKLPFGIAQIGKSFRNEITPRNFIFRTREFEQMEVEFFCKPPEKCQPGERTDVEWHEYWLAERFNWYLRYGMRQENLRLRPHAKDELAHYAKGCSDVEYKFPIGWQELEGIANRTDFDLKQHQQHSGKDCAYFDPYLNEKYLPYVIEPSAGVDRSALAFLCDAYHSEQVEGRERVVLKLHHALAPIKVAVLPLLKNRPEIVELATKLTLTCKRKFYAVYDDTAAIGKLYRRQDEIGTPYCVTIDVESLTDGKVTVRERDTMAQDRIAIDSLTGYLQDHLMLE